MSNYGKSIDLEDRSKGSFQGAAKGREGLGAQFFLWLAAILTVAGAAYIDVAWSDPIFQRAEDFFAESAREMFALSRYITPFMFGKPFIDKPILSYWSMEASFALLGVSHFSARVPFVLAALATAALTACGVARIWGRSEGLVAAAVLCSSFGFFYFATLSMSDIWLTLCCAAASAWIFAGSLNEKQRTWDWFLAGVMCAFAVLAKGPVGLLLPAGAGLVYLAIRRELRQIRPLHLLLGLGPVVIIAGGWFALLWMQTGSVLVRQFFLEENLRRFEGATYQMNLTRTFGYIPEAFLLYFLPWTVFLPFSLAQSWRKWRTAWDSDESRGELFLWCIIVTLIAFFWAARSVNDYYVLPAMPACAALAGVYLTRAARKDSRVVRITAWFLAAILILAGGIAGGMVVFSQRASLHVFLPLLAWIFLSGVTIAFFAFRRRYGVMLATMLLALSGGTVLATREIIPTYARAFPFADLARAVHGDQGGKPLGSLPVAISGDMDHWRMEVAFQTERVPAEFGTPQEFEEFLRGPGPRLALVTDEWMGKVPPDLTGQVQLIYQTPIPPKGLTLADFLDPSRIQNGMNRVSWIYAPGTDALK